MTMAGCLVASVLLFAAGCGAASELEVQGAATGDAGVKAPPDAGAVAPPDAGPDASPNCGAQDCDPATQYCFDDLLGMALSCRALPPACTGDPTCNCVWANVPPGPCVEFMCESDAGVPTILCASG